MFNKTIATLAIALMVLGGSISTAFAKEIRWGTSRVGSSGHKAVTNLAEMLKRKMPEFPVTVQPTPGAILTVKGYTQGQFEGYYGSDVAFYELANNIKRFKGFKEQMKKAPVQSFWTFTVEMGVAVHARDKDSIKSWGDLSGKRVFTGPRPWDTRAQLERAFEALGVKHEYIEVDIKSAGSLLEGGRFSGFGVYTNAEASTARWITETSMQTDWAGLNLSDAERKTLESKGFKVVDIPLTTFGKKVTHAPTVSLLPFYYGLHVGMEIAPNDLLRMLKIIEANAQDLAKADKSFKQIAADMPAMQVRGVNAALNLVEIHPGLAMYMKEKGIWDSKWDSRVAKGGM